VWAGRAARRAVVHLRVLEVPIEVEVGGDGGIERQVAVAEVQRQVQPDVGGGVPVHVHAAAGVDGHAEVALDLRARVRGRGPQQPAQAADGAEVAAQPGADLQGQRRGRQV